MKKHIIQFFKFLEDKEGKPAPLKLKLLDPQTFGEPTKEDLNVKGDLRLSKTDIKELPQGLEVSKHLWLDRCTSLKKISKGLKVGGSLTLQGCTSLKELPQDLEVRWSLNLASCTSLEELPKGLEVGFMLDLSYCTSLEKLPQGLAVNKGLYLRHTNIKELPQNLQVGGDLDLKHTPIAEKYSEEEIRKMIKDGGGFVKGKIYKD